MGKKRIFGILFITISILMAFSNLTIVGAVIGTNASDSLGWVAIAFFVVGLALMIEREGNFALNVMESGRSITKPREVRRIATKMGYDMREAKEGTKVLDYEGKPFTVIPKHDFSPYTGKGILESLAIGMSSFRPEARYFPIK